MCERSLVNEISVVDAQSNHNGSEANASNGEFVKNKSGRTQCEYENELEHQQEPEKRQKATIADPENKAD